MIRVRTAGSRVSGREVLTALTGVSLPPQGGRSTPMLLRDISVREYAKLLGPFVGCVALGLLASAFPSRLRGAVLVHFLGDGLVVAGVIGAVIELFSAKFLIERVGDHLAEKLVGRGLPPELQAHIREVVATDIVRDHLVKSYSLSDPQNGQVTVDVQAEWDVRNYSDSARSYAPALWEETFYKPEFLEVEYGVPGGGGHAFRGANLERITKTDPGTHRKQLAIPEEKKVVLDPIARNERAVCVVHLRYRLTMPQEYSDVTGFAGATLGATVRALRVPNGFEFIASGERVRHEVDSLSWHFEGPFIKGQHVRAWWFRKSTGA